MADGEVRENERFIIGKSFADILCKYIGETVTIFTSSGGQSGSGFTGVILAVDSCIVRLISRIGPPPACSLGNACTGFGVDYRGSNCNNYSGINSGVYGGPVLPADVNGSTSAGGWNGYPVYTVGSITDIPVSNIVSFVHNAV